jgi:hypothetical protein
MVPKTPASLRKTPLSSTQEAAKELLEHRKTREKFSSNQLAFWA